MAGKSQRKKVFPNADQIKEAADYGVDVSALIDNIKKSPAEHIKRHNIALNTVEKLRKARRL